MSDLSAISDFLQKRLESEGLEEVSAVAGARWLDEADLLPDSSLKPGLSLRKTLRDINRAGRLDLIAGAYQDPPKPYGRWWIRRAEDSQRPQSGPQPRSTYRPAPPPTDGSSTESIVTIKDAQAAGFTGFLTVDECIRNDLPRDPALNECGVYLVCDSSGSEPVFIPPEEARETRNVIRPWPVSRLEGKWVDAAEILYIGLAGAQSSRALRKRLRDLCRHANGHTTDRGPHRGGEILWQLRGYEQLLICWHPTAHPPAPRNLERSLISSFDHSLGTLPFANRQR